MSTLMREIKNEFMKVLQRTSLFFVILYIVVLILSLMIKGSEVALPI